jgi:hypothetical protein
MRHKYTTVRARSANEGSGTAGWSLAAPGPACFLMDGEDILQLSLGSLHGAPHQSEDQDSRSTVVWRFKGFGRAPLAQSTSTRLICDLLMCSSKRTPSGGILLIKSRRFRGRHKTKCGHSGTVLVRASREAIRYAGASIVIEIAAEMQPLRREKTVANLLSSVGFVPSYSPLGTLVRGLQQMIYRAKSNGHSRELLLCLLHPSYFLAPQPRSTIALPYDQTAWGRMGVRPASAGAFSSDSDLVRNSLYMTSECKGGGKFVGKWEVSARNTTLCPVCRSPQPVRPYGGRYKIADHREPEVTMGPPASEG